MFGEGKEFIDAVVCRLDAEDMIHKAIEGEGKVGVDGALEVCISRSNSSKVNGFGLKSGRDGVGLFTGRSTEVSSPGFFFTALAIRDTTMTINQIQNCMSISISKVMKITIFSCTTYSF